MLTNLLLPQFSLPFVSGAIVAYFIGRACIKMLNQDPPPSFKHRLPIVVFTILSFTGIWTRLIPDSFVIPAIAYTFGFGFVFAIMSFSFIVRRYTF